jgi:Tol biopolymer transport system component
MNGDGSQYRQITAGNYSNKNPRFNADGDKVAFISDRSGSDQIYLINVDGNGEKQLTNSKTIKYDLVWGHNNKALLYNVGDEQDAEIYILSITDKKEISPTRNRSREAIPTFHLMEKAFCSFQS